MSETILTKGFKKKTTENLCNGDDHMYMYVCMYVYI